MKESPSSVSSMRHGFRRAPSSGWLSASSVEVWESIGPTMFRPRSTALDWERWVSTQATLSTASRSSGETATIATDSATATVRCRPARAPHTNARRVRASATAFHSTVKRLPATLNGHWAIGDTTENPWPPPVRASAGLADGKPIARPRLQMMLRPSRPSAAGSLPATHDGQLLSSQWRSRS